jgi:rhamnose transport system permease protein
MQHGATAPATPPATERKDNRALKFILSQEMILLVLSAIAIAVLSTQNERFLTMRNLSREIVLAFEVALIALPMTFIIITGGIDLSVGSIFGMTAIIMGFLWQDSGLPLELAMLLGLGVGFIAGMINAFFIVIIGVPPLITTLATLALYRGIALGISEARSARGFPEWFQDIGRGGIPVNLTIGDQTLAVIPWQLVIIVIAVVIFGVVLSRTTFGRSLYAIGNNEVAARFAGIRTGFAKFVIYTTSGVMASIAAIVFVSRVTTTRSDMGSGIELDAIAAVVLGGTSIFGGSGSILGTILGLILIQVLKNGLLLAGVRGDGTIIMIGVVLIIAVLVNNFIQSKLGSR